MFGKNSSFSSIFNSVFQNIILPLCLIPLGLAIITINPTNVTTCLGSPAVFTCVITESLPILWLINGTPVQSPPPTTPLTPGPGSQSTLSVTATNELNGTSVQCYYTPSVLLPSIVSPPTYLSVQAPPSAPTNLTTTALNATSVLLAWGPPFGAQSPSLFYRVLITSGNGTLVYNKTVKELQLILTTPDPCDQYWANVTTFYGNSIVCTGNSIMKAIKGGPPATISITNTSNVFSNSSRDNVTVKFILPSTPGICYYTIIAKAKDGIPETAIDKPYSESEGMINISLSLRPLKHFNVFFTANNAQELTNATISTFSVINVTANTSGPQCVYYNDHSPAIGCVMYLKNTTSDVTYCRVLWKSNNTSANTSLCNSSYFNGPLNAGMYIVEAYDIGSDGNVSELPAICGVTLHWSTALQANPTTSESSSSLGAIVGGVAGAIILLAVPAVIVIIIWKKKQNMAQAVLEHELSEHSECSHGRSQVQSDGPSTVTPESSQMSKTTVQVSHYGEIDFTALRPIVPPPLDNTEIKYATVKNAV